jgi:uncharacterized cupredoxin-like copper-binding protein
LRRWSLVLAPALVAGLIAGGAIGMSAAARPKPCQPRKHHRCPALPIERATKRLRAPRPTVTTTTTATTTTGTTTTGTTTTTTTTTGTTTPAPLPSRLEVDENDLGQLPQPYSLVPSHDPVASGSVQFNVYNFGQDDHTFAIQNAAKHQLAFAKVPAGQSQSAVQVKVLLAPGKYLLLCTLAGHDTLGMRATLTVQ